MQMESFSEKQKTLIGVFPDVPECLRAWDVVKKVASGGGDVSSVETVVFTTILIVN
jgi:hypothetical protein